MMKLGNNFAFNKLKNESINIEFNYECATTQGVCFKTGILLGITFLTSLFMLAIILKTGSFSLFLYLIVGIVATVLQIIININPLKAKSLAIPYAISEGLVISCLCGLVELALPGNGLVISGLALLITLSIFLAAVFLYSKRIITVGFRFRSFLLIAGLGVIVFSVFFSLLAVALFFINGMNLYSVFYFSGLGVVVSLFMCLLASMYVIYSLSVADNLISSGVEKTMEWYAAYAITLNVIYLYIEILRLLIILFGRKNNN